MGLLAKVLTFPVSAPAAGLRGLVKKLHETAQSQYYDAEAVRSQMVRLGEQVDAGTLDEDEYEALEEQLLDRLDEIADFERSKAEQAP